MMPIPRNTLIQGNALELLPAWPAESVNLLLTDPPYGNAATYGRSRTRIIGDEHPLVGLQAVAATYRLLKRNSTAYVFCGASHLGFLEHFFLRYSKFRLRELLVWDKQQMGFGNGFRRRYEAILVLEKGTPTYNEKAIPTVFTVPRLIERDHPHEKPVVLLERLIRASSNPGDLVLDPFAGSGSTLVASRNTGRDFLGVEIDPHYSDIARSRLGKERRAA